MQHERPIITTAIVLSPGKERLYEVSLPNGKLCLAHIPPWLKDEIPPLAVGQRVTMEMTPYDFNTGRIAGIASD
jgi:translation initiation factor IF-1